MCRYALTGEAAAAAAVWLIILPSPAAKMVFSSALSLKGPAVARRCLSDPAVIDLISQRKAPVTSKSFEETGDEGRHDRATIDNPPPNPSDTHSHV